MKLFKLFFLLSFYFIIHTSYFITVSFAQTPIPTLPVGSNTFLETFNGNPAAPQNFSSLRWDIAKQIREQDSSLNMDTMEAHHGGDCAAPLLDGQLVTHTISNLRDSVFLCKDHLMTAIRMSSYGLVYLTPNHMVDFTNGEAIIRFDMTTFRSSSRDWIDIWITPFEDTIQLPFDNGDVDLQGIPKRSVHITMGNANGNGTMFRPSIINNHTDTGEFPTFSNTHNWWTGYESFIAPDPEFSNRRESPKRRDTFEMRISRTHLKFCMPGYNFCWFDKNIADIGWSKGVVQFGHHSYTPDKDCGTPGTLRCSANTWHWDNIYISPSVPFTIIKANKIFLDSSMTDKTITFETPAPANAFLRFGAIGRNIQYRCNGGAWTATIQPPQNPRPGDSDGHYASYSTPIPVGCSTVELQGQNWWGGGWRAKDFSIFSETLGSTAPINTPTPTGTVVSPTPTITNITPTTARKPGDCQPPPNGDGDVDIFDYNALVGSFGSTSNLTCDFVNPGAIDIFDYNILVGAFGT